MTVTVVTATVPGREHMLEECKASVAAQTVQAARHIVRRDDTGAGCSAMYTALVADVDTEWVVMLSDDDILYPTFLERLLAHEDQGDVVYAWCDVTGRGDYKVNRSFDGSLADVPVQGIYSRNLFTRIGGWRPIPISSGGPDMDFHQRALTAGAVYFCVEEVLWQWRFHGANLCTDGAGRP